MERKGVLISGKNKCEFRKKVSKFNLKTVFSFYNYPCIYKKNLESIASFKFNETTYIDRKTSFELAKLQEVESKLKFFNTFI